LSTDYKDSGESGKGEDVASLDDCARGRVPPKGKYCPFDYKTTFDKPGEKCNANNKFGYELGQPCILIKLNRVSMSCFTLFIHLNILIL